MKINRYHARYDLLKSLFLALFCTAFICSNAVAGQTTGYSDVDIPRGNVSDDYPGVLTDGSDLVYDYELYWIKAGLYTYFKLHGEWPESWAEVVEDNLFVVDLITIEGNIIEPDDSQLRFFGDVFYFPPTQGSTKARFVTMKNVQGTVMKQNVLDPPMTISDMYSWAIENTGICDASEEVEPYVRNLISDPLRLKQIALATMLRKGITLYTMVNGHPPITWEEYLLSGLAPIQADSLNPLTGKPYLGDGSPNDFYYRSYTPEETGTENYAVYFTHIDANGHRPFVHMSY